MPASLVLFLALSMPSQANQHNWLHELLTEIAVSEGLMARDEYLTDDLNAATEFVLGNLAMGYRYWPGPEHRDRLPDREVAIEAIDENDSFCKWCQGQIAVNPRNQSYYLALLKDAKWRRGVWENIKEARYDYKAPYYTRLYLYQLREAIGGEDFARGLWPHPLPVWSFQRE